MNLIDVMEASFEVLDKNGDGFVSLTELENTLITYGLPRSDAQKIFRIVDQNKDGRISRQEFMRAVKRLKLRRITSSELKRVFAEINTTKNGQITYSQFKAYIIKYNPKMPEFKIRGWFQKYDGSQKGYLEYSDFVHFAMDTS